VERRLAGLLRGDCPIRVQVKCRFDWTPANHDAGYLTLFLRDPQKGGDGFSRNELLADPSSYWLPHGESPDLMVWVLWHLAADGDLSAFARVGTRHDVQQAILRLVSWEVEQPRYLSAKPLVWRSQRLGFNHVFGRLDSEGWAIGLDVTELFNNPPAWG